MKEAKNLMRRDENERDRVSRDINALVSVAQFVRLEFESTRRALLAAIASHRDAREEVRADPFGDRTSHREGPGRGEDGEETRGAARDASTQSDDAHSACGRRVERAPRIP